MDYEFVSEFEINKVVAGLRGYLVQDIGGGSVIGMNRKFHKQYPNTVWVAKADPITGEQISVWEQKCFTRIADDAWPIILESGICITSPTKSIKRKEWSASWDEDGGRWSTGGISFKDKNPLRAAMIIYLMINDK